jgi:hypothetical protein
MAQRIAMSFVFQQMLKEMSTKLSMEQKERIERQVDTKLVKVLGSDWSKLPVTGPRMMVLVIILNTVLLPFGVAPAVLAEVAMRKGKEYNVERRFVQLIESSKGEFSKEKLQEFKEYASKTGDSVKNMLSTIISSGVETTKGLMNRGKNLLSDLSSKKSREADKE